MSLIKHTEAALYKIVDDVKRFRHTFVILAQSLYVAYLIYALMRGQGIWWTNALLLVLSLAYFIFYLSTSNKIGKGIKVVKKNAARFYKRFKLATNGFTLAVTIYTLVLSIHEVDAISIVLAAVTALGWILQILLEVLSSYVEHCVEMLKLGFNMDMEAFFATKIGGLAKKTIASDFEPAAPDGKFGKMRDFLVQKAQEREEIRARKKEEKRAAKREKRRSQKKKSKPLALPEGTEEQDE